MRREGKPAVRMAISTCGPQLEVAFTADAAGPASLVRLRAGRPRSTLVLAAIDLLVENAGLTAGDLELIVVSRGPGSFTGIRAGLATAAGLAAATGADCLAYDSLMMHAGRCSGPGAVWAAQPGRRGEVYGCAFEFQTSGIPRPVGDVEVLRVDDLGDRGPWVAAEDLDIGGARWADRIRSGAESLLMLEEMGAEAQPLEPLYIEGPPIHRSAGGM